MGSGPVREGAAGPVTGTGGLTPRRSPGRWLRRLLCLLVLVTVLLVWLRPGWVLPPLARYLDVSQPPRATDYVLILNGDPETRPFAAAALVRAGLVKEVLLTRQRLSWSRSRSRKERCPRSWS